MQARANHFIKYIQVLQSEGTEMQRYTISMIDEYRIQVDKASQEKLELEEKVKLMANGFSTVEGVMQDKKIRELASKIGV